MNKIAILLLNWNCLEETKKCVQSIVENDDGEYDIYILDNNSDNDEFEKLVNYFNKNKCIFLYSLKENIGFTGGNNYLIKKAEEKNEYEYYFLLNNDTEIEKNAICNFLKVVDNRKGVFGPQVRYFENKELLQSVGGRVNLWTGICSRKCDKKVYKECSFLKEEKKVDYIFGCAFLISKEVIDKIGLLNDDYFIYYEEVDYCVRASMAGFDIKYIPRGVIYHKDSVATKKITGFHIYMMFRNRIIFLKKYASFLQFCYSLLYLFLYAVYFFGKYGVKEGKFLFIGSLDGLKNKKGDPMKYMFF